MSGTVFKSQFKTEKVTSKNIKKKLLVLFLFFYRLDNFGNFIFILDRPTLEFWKFSRKSEN